MPEHPLPNDDLDLQLVWLRALETYGERLGPDEMARSFLAAVDCHWDEYGVALRNLRDGLKPPLSGKHNNFFHNGLGAAIRSEIWACVFPGAPETAAYYAMLDATIDHSGDGVYAEVFNAAAESALLGGATLDEALDAGKRLLPERSLLKRMYRRLDQLYRAHHDFRLLHKLVVENYASVNFTDCVMNGGFVYSALLAGEGDFERTVLLAVNCGQDTDCTAATAGAMIGALHGRKAIPSRWSEVVDDRIAVGDYLHLDRLPGTVSELAERVVRLAESFRRVGAEHLPRLKDGWDVPECGEYGERRECLVNGVLRRFDGMKLDLDAMPGLVGHPVLVTGEFALPEETAEANLLAATRGIFRLWIDGVLAAVKGDQAEVVPAPHRVRGGRLVALDLRRKKKFRFTIEIAPTEPVPELYLNLFDWQNRHIKARWTAPEAGGEVGNGSERDASVLSTQTA